MFPNLRLLLAGVSALFLVTLGALSLTFSAPPGAKRVASATFAPRGVLISRDDHPEWEQFLHQATLRRAGELAKLRDLPDQPDADAVRLRLASLPADPQDHFPQDHLPEDAAELTSAPSATIPVGIGAASSAELPVHHDEPLPPAEPQQRIEVSDPPTELILAVPTIEPTAEPLIVEQPAPIHQAVDTPSIVAVIPEPKQDAEPDLALKSDPRSEPVSEPASNPVSEPLAELDNALDSAPPLALAEVKLPRERPTLLPATISKKSKATAKRKLRRTVHARPSGPITTTPSASTNPVATLFGSNNNNRTGSAAPR
jgi:hypothetical protein